MRTKGTAAELERIRMKAIQAMLDGERVAVIARVLRVHESTVYGWKAAYRDNPASLCAKPNLGRPMRLSADDLARLEELLMKGAVAHGWSTDVWTCPRVALLIEKEFGIEYHPDHLSRLLRFKLNWTSQKPATVAREQDPEAVERFKREEFPRIKKLRKPKAQPSYSSMRPAS